MQCSAAQLSNDINLIEFSSAGNSVTYDLWVIFSLCVELYSPKCSLGIDGCTQSYLIDWLWKHSPWMLLDLGYSDMRWKKYFFTGVAWLNNLVSPSEVNNCQQVRDCREGTHRLDLIEGTLSTKQVVITMAWPSVFKLFIPFIIWFCCCYLCLHSLSLVLV